MLCIGYITDEQQLKQILAILESKYYLWQTRELPTTYTPSYKENIKLFCDNNKRISHGTYTSESYESEGNVEKYGLPVPASQLILNSEILG